MNRRFPRIKEPRTFYDVFSVVVVGLLFVTTVLSVWRGTIIRIEMAVFSGFLFLWVVWAIGQILNQSARKPLSQVEGWSPLLLAQEAFEQ